MCSGYFTLPFYLFFVLFIPAFFCIRKFKLLTDLLLLIFIFITGFQISSYTIPEYVQDSAYLINSRCEEILPRHHYILSAGQQKFYLNNHNTDTLYHPGDSLIFCARIIPFNTHVNPGEFSYAHYLKQKKVFCQVIPLTPVIQKGHSHDISSFFFRLREKFIHKTTLFIQDSTCRMLINALCLGYKTELDYELRNLFITTGTVHLLSVSGLHTGALYLFFLFILKHIGLTHRKTEILLLPLLWSYACLTGLAPSVVRASTILSFIAIGKIFCRTYTPLNSLAASAFFTLLIQPSALYSISFLLSYSAYTGILVFYPFLFRLPGTLPSGISKIYACCCITIAAQIPTLPLCAFYFHTVNINGFLANLIAVPLATLLLYCSACCLIFPLFISQYFSPLCELLCQILIKFLQYFAPYSINIQNLYPSPLSIVLIYGLLCITGCYLYFRKCYWLYSGIVICTLLLFYLSFLNFQLASKNEIVIFHHPEQSVILLNHNGFCLYLQNTLNSPITSLPYIHQHKLKTIPPGTGIADSKLFYYSNQLIYVKDTISILTQKYSTYYPCNILIISNNVLPEDVFRPSDMQTPIPPRIILDSSNNTYSLEKWKLFCQQYQITLQNTTENGFIRLSLK